MTMNFFRDLPSFTLFAEACDPRYYRRAPEDWLIVLTDVRDSTKAIEAGRYKEVNMVGAACITAVVNACKGINVPYCFGGDGAELLIPPAALPVVKQALLSVRAAAQAMHGLALRIGIVPVSEITRRGKSVEVAKYLMPTGCVFAMFQGGGMQLADKLIKQGEYALGEEVSSAPPDLTGLSCRWQPIPARKDVMLTLLVMALPMRPAHETYQAVNRQVAQLLDGEAEPVHWENMRYSWPSQRLMRASQMAWRQGNQALNLLDHIIMTLWFRFLHRFHLKVRGFDVKRYRQDMITNSDYRKFDDMLRMVADCTREQAATIEAYLAELHARGEIAYGTHYSDTALMTCFVTAASESGGHVHFIDGNDGGYALAAKQLKQRLGVR